MSYRTQIDQTYQSLKRAQQKLSSKISRYDLYQSDLLHYIENEKYDAAMGSQLLKKLKENRIARRKYKKEQEEVFRMLQALDTFYAKHPSKKYHYRIADKEHILDVNLEGK